MSRARPVLDRVVRVVEECGFGAHAVHVQVGDDGELHRWSDDVRRDVHSVAKAVCVLAAGLASDEGVLDVDAPVSRYLPGLAYGEGSSSITTRHLLGMVSGVDLPWSPTLMSDWPDLAHEFLGRPSRGRVFQYSNASTYTAMRALGAVVGDVHAWLGPRLYAPLDLHPPDWRRCPQGWIVAGEGLSLTAEELARLGRLVRDDGVRAGRRVVSSEWTRAMHSGWTVREAGAGYTHYALAGWGGPRDAWRLHGAHGQILIFRGDTVVTVVADDHARADDVADRIVGALAGR